MTLKEEFEKRFMDDLVNTDTIISWIEQKIKQARMDENKLWGHIAEFSHDITPEQFNDRIKELEGEK